MASGLPPVVTDIVANRAWIKDGENGFLFPVKDYESLAAKIVCLLRDKEKRETCGEASRRIVTERGNQETESVKIEQIYERVLNYKAK